MTILKIKKIKTKQWKKLSYDIGYFEDVVKDNFIIEITEDELYDFLKYRESCKGGMVNK